MQVLPLDAAGNLYGTTYQGGSSAANNLNYGTVYKLAAGTYKESVLWSFGTSGDGYYPLPPTDSGQWEALWYGLCRRTPWRGRRI